MANVSEHLEKKLQLFLLQVVGHCDEIDWYDQIIVDSNARTNNLVSDSHS